MGWGFVFVLEDEDLGKVLECVEKEGGVWVLGGELVKGLGECGFEWDW